nr:immunoglobulin heavy chain junction region [Mus musculus]
YFCARHYDYYAMD